LECIKNTPHLEDFITSLYNCRYRDFFVALAGIEPILKGDWLLAPHATFIIKEMRIRAYAQLLQSYSSLALSTMAESFGVSVDFMDR
jgi:26S proteasome regulatory subunit N7